MYGADEHGAFRADGGHQAGGKGPGAWPLSQACHGINLMYNMPYIEGFRGVVDSSDGHGAFGANGDHQTGGRGQDLCH